MPVSLLEIADLRVELKTGAARPILDGVSLSVDAGEVVGLVGESGSGKSMTARSAVGLLPAGTGSSGSVRIDGTEVLNAPAETLQRLRREKVAMIFQDPRTGLNPVRRIGDFLTEGPIRANGWDKARAQRVAMELLAAVGLSDPERRMRQYPHELSGGMLQRVMIASALMVEPRLLLCDEPTTALDVTTQAEIINVLTELRATYDLGVLFITHDLDLAAAICDRICVMYAGRIVEIADYKSIFTRPRHPYTVGLLASTPQLRGTNNRLQPVPGTPLSLAEAPSGCAFGSRCGYAEELCFTSTPPMEAGGGRSVACRRSAELADQFARARRDAMQDVS
jgi:peptide/nickel transport system ATP-binding protein